MFSSIDQIGDSHSDVTRISVKEGASSDHVVIQDAHFLLAAHFKKMGSDLILSGDDGRKIIVEGYFDLDKRPELTAPGGGGLSAQMVERLTVSETAGQYAQAGAPAGAAVIGKVERIGGGATVQHANGVTQELQVGDQILQGDVVQTRDGSQLGLSFIDGTAFNMGANARMVLSELIYSADTGASNSAVFSIVKGAVSFVAGQVAKTGDMRVETPISTMGIRGTAVSSLVETDAFNNVLSVMWSLMSDPDGHIGGGNISDASGNIIGTLGDTSTATFIRPANNLTVLAQTINKTPEIVQQELAIAQILFPIFLSNPVNVTNLQVPDLQPRFAGALGSSELFATRTITETISVFTTPALPTLGDNQTKTLIVPSTVLNVVLRANLAPLINIDSSPHLIEAANGNPGVDTSIAPVIKSDLDGTALYDTSALIGDHWDDLGNGIFAKFGSLGAATLDTVGVTASTLASSGWTSISANIFQKIVILHDGNGNAFSEAVRVDSSANTLTYALDNVKADPLHQGEIVEDQFTIPVIDDGGAKNSAMATFKIVGVNDAPVAHDDAYSATLGHTLHVPAHGVLANDFDAEHDVLSASFNNIVTTGSNAGVLTIVGGTPFTLGANFNPLGWSNPDGIGVGSTIELFDGHSPIGSGLSLSAPSLVTFTFLGSEAGFDNAAFFGGTELFDGHTTSVGAAVDGLHASAGLLDFLYENISLGNAGALNGGPINSHVLLGFDVVNAHRAYAFFKDTATGDNDFDDMVVRIDVSPLSQNADGLLKLNPDGSFDYQPYFKGSFAFSYTANDGALNSANPATVTINVGTGADTLDFLSSTADTQVTLSDTPGASFITSASTGHQTLADGITNVLGGSGADTINGSNSGATLNGGAGNDTVKGGTGNDIIIGGLGNDQLTGGGGNDVFVFRFGFGHDTVTDFDLVHDILDLRSLGFTSIADLLNHTDSGPSAVIHAGADDISLQFITKTDLLLHVGDLLV